MGGTMVIGVDDYAQAEEGQNSGNFLINLIGLGFRG